MTPNSGVTCSQTEQNTPSGGGALGTSSPSMYIEYFYIHFHGIKFPEFMVSRVSGRVPEITLSDDGRNELRSTYYCIAVADIESKCQSNAVAA